MFYTYAPDLGEQMPEAGRRIASLGASLALAAALLGAYDGRAASADDGPPDPLPPGIPKPPDLSPEQAAAAQAGLQHLSELGPSLEKLFPEQYGGLFASQDPATLTFSFTIAAVGEAAELKTFVNSTVALIQKSTASIEPVTYVSVKHTHAHLTALADTIDAKERADWRARGFPIYGVAVDNTHNAVALLVSGPVGAQLADFASHYGVDSSVFRLRPGKSPTELANRQHDNAPWNGGDAITGPASCTSGFGFHNQFGTFLLTAGHCQNGKWYQDGRLIGSTAASNWTQYGPSYDEQAIFADSSPLVWKQLATRVRMAGAVTPFEGSYVCSEGVTTLEQCGWIVLTGIQVEVGSTGRTYLDQFMVEEFDPYIETLGGDSGAPIIGREPGGGAVGYGILSSGAPCGDDCTAVFYGQSINGTLARWANGSLNT